MKKIIVVSFPLIFIVIALSIAHVIVSNMLSTTGVELDKLQTDLQVFQKENTFLREKVLVDTSFNSIASVAAEMGFVDSKSNVYLPEQIPLTRR
jgi:cell division protein FtsL